MPIARRFNYRRDLPHLQSDGCSLFVTFRKRAHFVLPPFVRQIVIDTCLARNGRVFELHAVVDMPEHVHMLFTPLPTNDGSIYSIPEIMHGVKGESAHRINKRLSRRGPVWQPESFDHIPRTEEQGTVEYIRQDPVRRRLVRKPGDYPWLWVASE